MTAPLQFTLRLFALGLLAAALSAQQGPVPPCNTASTVPTGTIGSGNVCYSNNGTLTASGVTIDGTANVQLYSGSSIQLLPAFSAGSGATLNAWVDTLPSAAGWSPSSGSGMTATFTWTATSPAGFSNVSDIFAILNSSLSGAGACYIDVRPNAQTIYVTDGTGNPSWSAGMTLTPGQSTGTFNPYCAVNSTGSSINPGANSVTVSITFQPAFMNSTPWNGYLMVQDNQGLTSPWMTLGSWLVEPPPQPVTITSNPAGLAFLADSVAYTSPQTFQWYQGSSHTIGVSSPQPAGNGAQYAWADWSDGGPVSHSITVPAAPTTYTADFETQYYLATSVTPGGAIAPPPPGAWYSAGSQVTLNAYANSGYQFSAFTGSASGNQSSITIVMNGPMAEAASFTLPPVLTITSTHASDFTQGQSGAIYTVTVRNSGAASTDGTNVTATEGIPPGLIPTSVAGSNWTCAQPAGPCSRSDALAAGASYPPLTLTLNVSPNSPSSVTNEVIVSGGGSASGSGSDPTNVIALSRYANPLAYATSTSVIGGVATTLTVTYTDDNGPADIAAGTVKIDNCYLDWDSSGNVRLYGQQNGQSDATGVLGQSAPIWAGNCTINLSGSKLITPAANPKALVLSLNITFPDQNFFGTDDQNYSPDFVGPHEVFAWGVTVSNGGLSTGQVDLGSLVVSQGQDFTLSLSPTGPVYVPGGYSTVDLTLTATGINGFNGTISISTRLQQVVGNCLGITYAPSSIAANTQTTITLINPNCPGVATAELHVQGTAIGISRPAANSPLLVNSAQNGDYTISVGAPTSNTLAPQGLVTYPVTVSSVNGESGSITLGLAGSTAPGVTCSLAPQQVFLAGYGTSASSSLTCNGSTVTPGATYMLQVTATGPSGTHNATVPLSTQGTTFQVTPSAVVHNTGQEVQITQSVPTNNAPSYTTCGSPDPDVTCRVVSSSASAVTLGVTASTGTPHGTVVMNLNEGAATAQVAIADALSTSFDLEPSDIPSGQLTQAKVLSFAPPSCEELDGSLCPFPWASVVVTDSSGAVVPWPAYGGGLVTGFPLNLTFAPGSNNVGTYNVYLDLCDNVWDSDYTEGIDTIACYAGPVPLIVEPASANYACSITVASSGTPIDGQSFYSATKENGGEGGVFPPTNTLGKFQNNGWFAAVQIQGVVLGAAADKWAGKQVGVANGTATVTGSNGYPQSTPINFSQDPDMPTQKGYIYQIGAHFDWLDTPGQPLIGPGNVNLIGLDETINLTSTLTPPGALQPMCGVRWSVHVVGTKGVSNFTADVSINSRW